LLAGEGTAALFTTYGVAATCVPEHAVDGEVATQGWIMTCPCVHLPPHDADTYATAGVMAGADELHGTASFGPQLTVMYATAAGCFGHLTAPSLL
jgi:hypothetical protein